MNDNDDNDNDNDNNTYNKHFLLQEEEFRPRSGDDLRVKFSRCYLLFLTSKH